MKMNNKKDPAGGAPTGQDRSMIRDSDTDLFVPESDKHKVLITDEAAYDVYKDPTSWDDYSSPEIAAFAARWKEGQPDEVVEMMVPPREYIVRQRMRELEELERMMEPPSEAVLTRWARETVETDLSMCPPIRKRSFSCAHAKLWEQAYKKELSLQLARIAEEERRIAMREFDAQMRRSYIRGMQSSNEGDAAVCSLIHEAAAQMRGATAPPPVCKNSIIFTTTLGATA